MTRAPRRRTVAFTIAPRRKDQLMGNGRVIVGCTHGEEAPDQVVVSYLTAGAAP